MQTMVIAGMAVMAVLSMMPVLAVVLGCGQGEREADRNGIAPTNPAWGQHRVPLPDLKPEQVRLRVVNSLDY